MRLIIPAPDFNLEHTLECGQAFRWQRCGACYYGVIGETLIRAGYNEGCLVLESEETLKQAPLREYFGLNENLIAIYKDIDLDRNIHSAILKFRGLRILNQGHWECLASYILSSYNNIARIKKMVEALSQRFGRRLRFEGIERYSFPTAEIIARASSRDLKKLGLGFRAGYLSAAAKKISSKRLDLAALKGLKYENAKGRLMSLKGVGDKVSDCILLFSFKKYEAFPVDVWIKKGMEKLYFRGKTTSIKTLIGFARNHFGRYAGYAQEYLYHYFRHYIR